MEEGRVWGGPGTECRQRNSPSLARLRPSVCAQQLQLGEKQPLSGTVTAPLYIQRHPRTPTPQLITRNHLSHLICKRKATAGCGHVKPATQTKGGI